MCNCPRARVVAGNLACVYSIAISKNPESRSTIVERAIKLLESADSRDWNDSERLLSDPELEAIREHDGCQAMIRSTPSSM